MNVILLYSEELGYPLRASDHRTIHVREILKAADGEEVAVGVVGGLMGTAVVQWKTDGGLEFIHISCSTTPPPLLPLTLILGTPRPPTARRLLRDLTSLGVQHTHWTASKLSEKSYLHSPLWTRDEWREEILLGGMQGRTTLLGENTRTEKFHELEKYTWPEKRFYLTQSGNAWPRQALTEAAIAVGPERGWSKNEEAWFETRKFIPLNLGPMTLRTETAALAAAALSRELWFNL